MQFLGRERKKKRSESNGNRNQNKQSQRPQNIIPIKGQEEEIGSSECWFQTSGGQREGGPATWCWGRSDCGPQKTWPAGKKVHTCTQRRQGKATRINKKCLVVPSVNAHLIKNVERNIDFTQKTCSPLRLTIKRDGYAISYQYRWNANIISKKQCTGQSG